MPPLIYKVVDRSNWQSAIAAGSFAGAEIDLQDGYIHLSSRDQVEETVRKHFAGREDLLLIEVDSAIFDSIETDSGVPVLRWETSRNDQQFPHLYAALDVSHVKATHELPLGPDGNHQFPW